MGKVEVPAKPNTREEAYLAAIAGQAVEVPAVPMTREEAYLDAILKNGSGGGGGGTTNYNELENKPQIAGTTLSGNKSLSDLGIASEGSVSSLAGTVGSLAEVVGDSESGLVKSVSDIAEVIPEEATSSNKLATEDDIPDTSDFYSVTDYPLATAADIDSLFS